MRLGIRSTSCERSRGLYAALERHRFGILVSTMRVKRLSKFTVVSGIGWTADLAIFSWLVSAGTSAQKSNILSASIAVGFVFLTSWRWIFRNHSGGVIAGAAKYFAWNAVAIPVASLLVEKLAGALAAMDLQPMVALLVRFAGYAPDMRTIVAMISKIMVTPVTMYANFVVTGYIVERKWNLY